MTAHLAKAPDLLDLVQECVGTITVDDDNVYLDKDMGRVVGLSQLVETSPKDKVFYAKRVNYTTYTRFVCNREPQPTRYISIVLHRDGVGGFELWSAWLGPIAPQFPGDVFETSESKPFWRTHALIWSNQPIQPGSETGTCPWDD